MPKLYSPKKGESLSTHRQMEIEHSESKTTKIYSDGSCLVKVTGVTGVTCGNGVTCDTDVTGVFGVTGVQTQ